MGYLLHPFPCGFDSFIIPDIGSIFMKFSHGIKNQNFIGMGITDEGIRSISRVGFERGTNAQCFVRQGLHLAELVALALKGVHWIGTKFLG